MANTKITSNVISDDIALGGNPTTTTQSAGNDTTRIATTAFVKAAIDATIDSAPGALDTLNELAAAIGDDANFSTTITNSIATKLPLAGGTMTGDLVARNIKLADGYVEFDKPSVKGFRFLQNDVGNDISIQQGDTSNANYVTKLNINTDGHVLIGKTNSGFSVAGIGLRGDVADFIRSENPAINVNRLSNNGDQIRFHQAGTLIGSIGSEGGDSLYIQSDGTGGGGLRFHNSGGITPLRNGATVHNAIDLGTSTRAFKDFYAAGLASVGHVVPNTAGTYAVNHLGVYSSGITLNAATSQTGWLMSAGSGKLSFASDGAKIGSDGLGFHSTMDNRIETDQTTATRMKFYLNDIAAGEWKRTGSGGSIRPNQYSTGDTAATLPALASYDDENTGVYFPAADSIGISVGGSQAMLFDNDKFATIGSESGIPNSLAGLQIKRGGLLINGTSNTTNFHTTAFLSNYWTYFGSSGTSGSYGGSFRVSVPSPTGTPGNAWGGFQLEIYIAGYNGKFCHAMLSGYTNGGVTLSESTIIRSSGSHSVSYGAYHTGGSSNQGFYFDIDIPAYTHPSAFYRITKAGDTSSDHETALGRDLVVAWS